MHQAYKVMACGLALTGLWSCADTRAALGSSTERLEHSTSMMARDAANSPGAYAPTPPVDDTDRPYPVADAYTRDTHVLAVDAHELRRAVYTGASDTDIKTAFDRVSRSFHAVRDEVEHSDSRDARRDLAPVSDDYAGVVRALRGYTDQPVS